jgi:hypothetical protein
VGFDGNEEGPGGRGTWSLSPPPLVGLWHLQAFEIDILLEIMHFAYALNFNRPTCLNSVGMVLPAHRVMSHPCGAVIHPSRIFLSKVFTV